MIVADVVEINFLGSLVVSKAFLAVAELWKHLVEKGRLIEMKIAKRCLALLSAVIILMTAFVGCGKSDTIGSSSESSAAEASVTASRNNSIGSNISPTTNTSSSGKTSWDNSAQKNDDITTNTSSDGKSNYVNDSGLSTETIR